MLLENLCLCFFRPLPFVNPLILHEIRYVSHPTPPTRVEDSMEVGGLKMVSMVSSNGIQDG